MMILAKCMMKNIRSIYITHFYVVYVYMSSFELQQH